MPTLFQPTEEALTDLTEILDDATRREFLAALAAARLLSACGDSSASSRPPAAGPATRSISHALGRSDVPLRPERVVALGGIYVANLLGLGLVPTGMGDDTGRQIEVYRDHLAGLADVAEVPTVGDDYEPSIEAVAALRPDLIVGDEFLEDLYPKLAAVAPTVAVTYINNGGWRERFPKVAEAVGRADGVDRVEAPYLAALEQARGRMAGQTVGFVRADGDGGFRLDTLPSAFAGSVAEDAGITTLQPKDIGTFDEGSGFLDLSAEHLGVLAGATALVLGDSSFYDPSVPDTLSVVMRNPLWATLPAVKNDRVVQVPGPIYNGGNHYAATLLLGALGTFG